MYLWAALPLGHLIDGYIQNYLCAYFLLCLQLHILFSFFAGMSRYFPPRNEKLVQVEGVNLPNEKKELGEKVDDLEHHLQEVPMDKAQTLNLEEVKCFEAEKIKLADRTPEICYECYKLLVSPDLLVPHGKFQDQAICLGGH